MMTGQGVTLDDFFASDKGPPVYFKVYNIFEVQEFLADKRMMDKFLEFLNCLEITAFYEDNSIYLHSIVSVLGKNLTDNR